MVDFENTQPESLDELPVGAFQIKVFVGAAQAKGRVPMKFSMSMQRHAAYAQYVQMTRSGPNAMDMHIAYFLGQLLAREPDAAMYIVSKDKDFDPLIEFLDVHGARCTRVKSIAEIVKQAVPVRAVQPAKQAAAPARQPAPAPAPKPAQSQPPKPAQRAKANPAGKQASQRSPQPATRAANAAGRPAPTSAKPSAAPASAAAKSAASDVDAIVKKLRSMNGKPGTRKSLAQTIAADFKHHNIARSEKEVELVIDELARRGLVSQDDKKKVTYSLG